MLHGRVVHRLKLIELRKQYEEIDRIKREAEEFAEADKKEREIADTVNKGDSIVFSNEKMMKEQESNLTEDEKKEIEKQKKTNESLAMTIDELASLTKIQEVAREQGLSYNNNNIKTVTEE